MKDMILFPEDIDRLNFVLTQLVAKANLLMAVLINKDGRLLTYQGSLEKIDTVSLAALVAGNSASTLAIANLMGETEFSTMYHQGKDRNIFIAIVDENTFVSLVFDDRTNIDRVKVFARQFDRQLKEALVFVYNKCEDDIDLDLDMGGEGFQLNQGFQSSQQQPNSDYDSYNTPNNQGVQWIDDARNAQEQSQIRNDDVNGAPLKGQSSQQLPNNDSQDSKYLYLQNKMRETVKRKNPGEDNNV